MDHNNDSLLEAIGSMSDAELNAEIVGCLNYKGQLPSVRHVLDRLSKECSITAKIEPIENPDTDPPVTMYRVYIKPHVYKAISVTALSQSRAVRVALFVWLRYDPAAPPIIRNTLRL